MAADVPLHQRLCRCGVTFYICRSCDRGQRFCSERCRQKARHEQRREANRRHQQSEEGRLDHRDRQRRYRQRRHGEKRVTDQGSRDRDGSDTIPEQESVAAPALVGSPAFCIRCGRTADMTEMNTNEETRQRQSTPEQEYVRTVLRAYLGLPETPDRWSRTDRRIAVELFQRQVPIDVVETAFVLGSARRLGRDPKKLVPPIRCLAYFVPVIDEVLTLPPPAGYIEYLRSGLPRQLMKLGLTVTANSNR